MRDSFPSQLWGLTQPSALPTASIFLPQNQTLNSEGKKGEEGLGLKISPQNNRNLEEIYTKDVKSRSSYENRLRWPRKVTSKYI